MEPFIKVQKLKQKSTRAAKVDGFLLVLSVLVVTGLMLAGGYEIVLGGQVAATADEFSFSAAYPAK